MSVLAVFLLLYIAAPPPSALASPTSGTCRYGAALQLVDSFIEVTPMEANLDFGQALRYVQGINDSILQTNENLKTLSEKIASYNLSLNSADSIKGLDSPLLHGKLATIITSETGAEWLTACTNAFKDFPVYTAGTPLPIPTTLLARETFDLMKKNGITVQPLLITPMPFGFADADSGLYAHKFPSGSTFASLHEKKIFGLDLSAQAIKALDSIPTSGICVGDSPPYATPFGRDEVLGEIRLIVSKLETFLRWTKKFAQLFSSLPAGRVGKGLIMKLPFFLHRIKNILDLLKQGDTFKVFTQSEYRRLIQLIPLLSRALKTKLNRKKIILNLDAKIRESLSTKLQLPINQRVESKAIFHPWAADGSKVHGYLSTSVDGPQKRIKIFRIWPVITADNKILTDKYIVKRDSGSNFTATDYLKYNCFEGLLNKACSITVEGKSDSCAAALTGATAPNCTTLQGVAPLSRQFENNFPYAFPASLCNTKYGPKQPNLITVSLKPDTFNIDCDGIHRTLDVTGPENNIIESGIHCLVRDKNGKILWEPSTGIAAYGGMGPTSAPESNSGETNAAETEFNIFTSPTAMYIILIPVVLFILTTLMGVTICFLQLGWIRCNISFPSITCGGKAGASPDDLREEIIHLRATNFQLANQREAQEWHNLADRNIQQLALENRRSVRGRITEL